MNARTSFGFSSIHEVLYEEDEVSLQSLRILSSRAPRMRGGSFEIFMDLSVLRINVPEIVWGQGCRNPC